MKTLLFVFGTRPEAIKLAPLIKEFRTRNNFKVLVCATGQHKEMVEQVVSFFDIEVDHQLNLMKPNQSLTEITAGVLINIEKFLVSHQPDLIFIQGDTTTVMATGLAAFYQKIPVAHIEAGLRSHNIYAPFPEEVNRKIAGVVTKFHFAPTNTSALNLKNEGVNEGVYVVGNTVIDSLFEAIEIIDAKSKKEEFESLLPKGFNPDAQFILMTCHRRENFGQPLKHIFSAIKKYAAQHPEISILYPVHKNPNINKPAYEELAQIDNVYLTEPLDYAMLVWVMHKSFFVLTDSGGIQEEAPSFGKPVLVLRDVTERVEAVKEGTAKLVGSNQEEILNEMNKLTADSDYFDSFAKVHNPYGDGKTSQKICEIVEKATL